ncbi:DNA-binding transcriptional LysR family regulator [Actinocorallia herbida]|uniref:DNA-binding transcriptional LysR family regulator n=1 Tax=Actinocorallia herbida TaxID=58109 RepID=A0A3N1D343_9ACTN|nr:LysR family transcriptional regulator [Actinocorallia herbida]ROO87939.1 DNA-binding transcriptional LysR family regulator [Actinocorallia herbida]
MEIQQLKSFVLVAEHGSFSEAARALGLSQPSLSQAVNRLEIEFQTELFVRTARGAVLTPAGERLIAPARRVLESVDLTQATVDALHGVMTGTVRVVAFHSFTTEAADVMAAFRKAFPEVVLRVHRPENDDAVAGLVAAGLCDVGFARVGEAGRTGHDVEIVPVAVEESVALVPAGSPLGGTDRPITLAEVASLPLIVAPPGAVARTAIEKLFAANGVDYRVAAESEHHETSLELVRGGVGAYLTTRGGLPGGAGRTFTVRRLSPRREWPIGLIHRKGTLPPAVAAFAETALSFFQARSPES